MKTLKCWFKIGLPVVWRYKDVAELWYVPLSTPEEILNLLKTTHKRKPVLVEFTLNTKGVQIHHE